jgi:hypothetical protein
LKPEASDILGKSADQLMGQLAPQLGASYAQGSAAILALLMKFAAQEYERGADIRVAENKDIRSLFAELAPTIGDEALRRRIETASTSRDDSFAISALNAGNHALRRVLIELQRHIEDTGAHDANKRTWLTLKAMADRRALSLF